MLTLHGPNSLLCDKLSRREIVKIGGLSALGLTLPSLLAAKTAPAQSKAKACIILFLMGGPPQLSTWDPKPKAPPEIRGAFKPIATAVSGIHICELMPLTAKIADKLCILRAMASNDNAHSSSGYYMLTGQPHQPMNFENANPGPPNDYPSMGGVLRKLQGPTAGLPAAVTLPMRIFNTDGSVWPGQTAGFLGRGADPWLFTGNPGSDQFKIDEFTLQPNLSEARLFGRHTLLSQFNSRIDTVDRTGVLSHVDRQTQQAFDILRSSKARGAFRLDQESQRLRERYGRSPFGQSVLLGRRLIEAGVKLVQVNWYRGPDEPSDNPCWDSHVKESDRLKNVLMPSFDRAYSALIEDLAQRRLLEETLVVCMAEFGRSPKMNASGGRDHWGYVYSLALAGGGVKGGQVLGASDAGGGHPKEGRVQPQDLTATVFHALGYAPETEIRDSLGRPLPISRGQIIKQAF